MVTALRKLTLLVLAVLVTPALLHAQLLPAAEKQKIEILIKYVGDLKDAKFVRNGSTYEPATAVRFLRGKWDANKADIRTVRDFIDKVATKSDTSGKPYLMRFNDGVVRPKRFYLLVLIACAISGVSFAARHSAITGTPTQLEESASQAGELRKVIRVVDGDTIVVGPNEKVRLIGVDTPETVHPKKAVQCFGRDAKQFTRDSVEGKTVRLVFDEANRRTQHKDKYRRTLAYVYLNDGRMLNRELIRQGYAHAYTRSPFRHLVEFRQLERQARIQTVGLWSSCSLSEQSNH